MHCSLERRGLGSQVVKREADLGVRSQDLSREQAHLEERQARRLALMNDSLAAVATEYRPSTRYYAYHLRAPRSGAARCVRIMRSIRATYSAQASHGRVAGCGLKSIRKIRGFGSSVSRLSELRRLRRCFNGLSWSRRRPLFRTSVLQSPNCEARCGIALSIESRAPNLYLHASSICPVARPTSARTSLKIGGGSSSSGKRRRSPGQRSSVPITAADFDTPVCAEGAGSSDPLSLDRSRSRVGSILGARELLSWHAVQRNVCRLAELEKQVQIGQAELEINQGALDEIRVRVLGFERSLRRCIAR